MVELARPGRREFLGTGVKVGVNAGLLAGQILEGEPESGEAAETGFAEGLWSLEALDIRDFASDRQGEQVRARVNSAIKIPGGVIALVFNFVDLMTHGRSESPLIKNTLAKDPTHSEAEALEQIYALLRPGDGG